MIVFLFSFSDHHSKTECDTKVKGLHVEMANPNATDFNFKEIFTFLAQYHWVHDLHLTRFLESKVWENFPVEVSYRVMMYSLCLVYNILKGNTQKCSCFIPVYIIYSHIEKPGISRNAWNFSSYSSHVGDVLYNNDLKNKINYYTYYYYYCYIIFINVLGFFQWSRTFSTMTADELNSLPFVSTRGSSCTPPPQPSSGAPLPKSLAAFLQKSSSLSHVRRQARESLPEPTLVGKDLCKGMSPKKLHEVEWMASLVHQVASRAGCSVIVDVGSGLVSEGDFSVRDVHVVVYSAGKWLHMQNLTRLWVKLGVQVEKQK